MEVVKVSAKSVPKSVAGAIAAVIRENGEVESSGCRRRCF